MALVFNAPPLGTNAVGGVVNYTRQGVGVGALQIVHLAQGTDLGDALTNVLVAQWTAPFTGTIRHLAHSNYSRAVTQTFLVYNNTQTANVVGAITPTTNVAGTTTTFTTPNFTAGDVIQLRVTTSGGSGAVKGLNVWLTVVPYVDSLSNQYV